MKPFSFLTLSSLLCASSVKAFEIWQTCKMGDTPCNQIDQQECEEGENNIAAVTFYPLLVCNANEIDTDESYLWLRGSAIKHAHGGLIGGQKVFLSDMDHSVGASGCDRFSYTTNVDLCQDHFNAQFRVNTTDGSSETSFDTYMKRICDIQASVTCTQGNTPCEAITECSEEALDYTYRYCIGTGYTKHKIAIDAEGTNAWTGIYAADKIFANFPDFTAVGAGVQAQRCWEKTITRTTCTTGKIPGAGVTGSGTVEVVTAGATASTEFQECSASASIPPNYFTGDVGGGGGGGGGGGKHGKSKSPMTKKTKAPATKGTKTPSTKGTKAPTTKGVRRRRN